MGFYKDSLIWLHEEYTHRTCIGLLGRQATLLRLLADSYEVALRFDKLLETMKQGPTLMEDSDLDYLEWYDSNKWEKPRAMKPIAKAATLKEMSFKDYNQFSYSYANRMKDSLGDRLNNFDDKRLHSLFYEVANSQTVISDSEFDLAIERNLKHLRETLLEIHNFKNEKVWKKADYASMYKDFYSIFTLSDWEKTYIAKEHKEWLKQLVTDPEKEDYYERRREILISLFNTGFLDSLKNTVKVLPDDDLDFGKIKDPDLVSDLNDTLKYYAAFKRLCPLEDGKFKMDNYAALGRYVHDNGISRELCWSFFHHLSLLEIVQNELEYIDNPNARPVDDNEVLEEFVDTVKRIMLKAEDDNGKVYTVKDNRGNDYQFTYQVNGKRFCQVIDHIKDNYPDMIESYIGGRNKTNALGVTCIAPFIGAVLRTHIFSDRELRFKDVEFAFKFVLGEKNKRGEEKSYIQKMSIKSGIDDQNIFKSLESIEKDLPKE